ncbi:hypothetical protein BDW59DRAFT_151658, partial [Aspergillus cavernicola]
STAPVPSDVAMRLFLTVLAVKRKVCRQVNIVTAYLHAALVGKAYFYASTTWIRNTSRE